MKGSCPQLVSETLGREFHWDTDDLALQNIQARVRAPGIWLLANARSLLLLTAGNRSEATLGYTTMDGDTCGSPGPLGTGKELFAGMAFMAGKGRTNN